MISLMDAYVGFLYLLIDVERFGSGSGDRSGKRCSMFLTCRSRVCCRLLVFGSQWLSVFWSPTGCQDTDFDFEVL